jgi:hypothetical protein
MSGIDVEVAHEREDSGAEAANPDFNRDESPQAALEDGNPDGEVEEGNIEDEESNGVDAVIGDSVEEEAIRGESTPLFPTITTGVGEGEDMEVIVVEDEPEAASASGVAAARVAPIWVDDGGGSNGGSGISSSQENASTCTICLEPWSSSGPHRAACLACGHLFGQSCILKWLQQSAKCPQCNSRRATPISSSSWHHRHIIIVVVLVVLAVVSGSSISSSNIISSSDDGSNNIGSSNNNSNSDNNRSSSSSISGRSNRIVLPLCHFLVLS